MRPMNGIVTLKAISENPGNGLNEERSSTPRNIAQKNMMKVKIHRIFLETFDETSM